MAKKKEAYTNTPTIGEVKSTVIEQHDLFNVFNYEDRWYIAIGNQVVSRSTFETKEEAYHYIDCKPWELILNTTAVMVENLKKIEQNQTK